MAKGVCELCGFADDSYRIEENDTVMKVCKFCHDGYLERMGLAPDADRPVEDVALTLDIDAVKEAGIDTEGLSGAELLQLEMELAARKKESARVPSLNEKQLDTLLNGSEDDRKVLGAVRQKEARRRKRDLAAGLDDLGEDYKASEELLRSGEELQQIMEEWQKVNEEPPPAVPVVEEEDSRAAPLIAKIVAPSEETATEKKAEPAAKVDIAEPTAEAEPSEPEAALQADTAAPVQENATAPTIQADTAKPAEAEEEKRETEQIAAAQTGAAEKEAAATAEREEEDTELKKDKLPAAPISMEAAAAASKETAEAAGKETAVPVSKEVILREKILAAANQTIDDDRIQITSPEVALSKDTRPKTNLDVAISEYAGGVRFLDSFKYVLHQVSYAVFLGLIVLAVSTVLFIRDGWQHGLIVLGAGVGAVAVGFLLMWYLRHCYELDRRALLLRIRQQEILFASMNSDCYRELRTKFTIIKALGWLLNKLTVLLPLVTVIGGNVAAVIVSFVLKDMFWLYPVVSAGATVGGVLIYYFAKFAADWIAYALDRERNQQIQQQTLLDILDRLKK